MTGNSYLLDTSIVIALFRGNQNVVSMLNKLSEVYLPVITLGELFVGAQRSHNKAKSIKQITDFSSKHIVVDCNSDTAEFYGEIKSYLFSTGRQIPENDIWISAIAKQHNYTILTLDKHFKEVKGVHTKQP